MTSAFGCIAYTLLVFVAILPKQVLTISQIPPTPQNVLFLKKAKSILLRAYILV